MSLAYFIQWLFEQWTKVLDWFSDRYYDLRNRLGNLYSIINSFVVDGYNLAVQYANDLLGRLFNTFYDLFNAVYRFANDRFNEVLNFVYRMKDDLIGFIRTERDYLYTTLVNVWDGVKADFNNLVNNTKVYLINFIIDLLKDHSDKFKDLLILIQLISKIKTLTEDKLLNKILLFFSQIMDKVVLFTNNPVKYILDILRDKIVSYLCYRIAEAMGTTIYELPKEDQ